MPEIEQEFPGLRKTQRELIAKKEFEKSEENPFNQAHARFDTTREEIRGIREIEKEKLEGRFAEK